MCLTPYFISRVDFHFAQVEPSRDDMMYVCLVALFSAAAARSISVAALLPDYLLGHLRFLGEGARRTEKNGLRCRRRWDVSL